MPASPRCLYLADYSFKELLSRPSPTAQEGLDVPRTLPAGPFVTGLLWPGVQVYSSVSSTKLGTLREAALVHLVATLVPNSVTPTRAADQPH